jgi:hypothetical protein
MSWDRVQQYRLAMEKLVLEQELPGFAFYDPIGRTYVSGNWRSNSGNHYGLHVQLTAGFPDECPSVYITSPSPLYGYARRKTIASYETSHAMHTWKSDRPGWVKVCTYHVSDWSADQTLVKVIRKGMLWILAYECHLDEGRDISDFLMSAVP